MISGRQCVSTLTLMQKESTTKNPPIGVLLKIKTSLKKISLGGDLKKKNEYE